MKLTFAQITTLIWINSNGRLTNRDFSNRRYSFIPVNKLAEHSFVAVTSAFDYKMVEVTDRGKRYCDEFRRISHEHPNTSNTHPEKYFLGIANMIKL